jgi:hypothetical protein
MAHGSDAAADKRAAKSFIVGARSRAGQVLLDGARPAPRLDQRGDREPPHGHLIMVEPAGPEP